MTLRTEKPAAHSADGLPGSAQLGGECDKLYGSPPEKLQADPIVVFRHGWRIGLVREMRCGTFEAIRDDGRSLGAFNSAFAAASAVLTEAAS